MTEIPIAARIPQELERELEKYMKIEHLERSVAIRRLLYKSLQEWREEYAIGLLIDGKTTISKAAEISGMDIWSFIARIKEKKINWIKDKIIEKDLEAFS